MMTKMTRLSFGVLLLCVAIVCTIGKITETNNPSTSPERTAGISTTTITPTASQKSEPATTVTDVSSALGKFTNFPSMNPTNTVDVQSTEWPNIIASMNPTNTVNVQATEWPNIIASMNPTNTADVKSTEHHNITPSINPTSIMHVSSKEKSTSIASQSKTITMHAQTTESLSSLPVSSSRVIVQTSQQQNTVTTHVTAMEPLHTTEPTTNTKTLVSTLSRIFGPRLTSILQQVTTTIPGLKDVMKNGFGLSEYQLGIIDGLVQGLMSSVGKHQTSISDILTSIQSSGLFNSLGKITGASSANINPKDTAELCELLNSTIGFNSNVYSSNMTIADLLKLKKPLDECHAWAKGNLKDARNGCQNNFTSSKLTEIPPGMVHNPYKWNKCQADLQSMFMGLSRNETWVLQMLDASAKPGNSFMRGNLKWMGNYKQCQDVSHQNSNNLSKIEGNICKASIKTTQVNPLDGQEVRLDWDLCLPKDCTDTDLNLFLLENGMCRKVWMTCTKDLDMSDDGRAIGALAVLALFGLLLIAGTVMELYLKHNKSREKYQSPDHFTNGHAGNMNQGFDHNEGKLGVTSFTEPNGKPPMVEMNSDNDKSFDMGETGIQKYTGMPHLKESIKNQNEANDGPPKEEPLPRWQRALLAFSIPRNTEKILSVKSTPGSIGCLHGIRVLSIGWVVLGHIIAFNGSTLVVYFIIKKSSFEDQWICTVIDNNLDKLDWVKTLGFQLILNAFLSVDTFFVLSGLLTCYLFLKTLGKKGRITPKEFVLYYVHRYWRLTPSLMIWIMIVACLMKYIGEGRPAWTDYIGANYCRDNWWTNLLYINNVYKREEACVGVTWFLAHDMQFYIVAPLAMIPWVYGKRVLGFLMALVLVCVHVASTIWLEIKYNADMLRNRSDYKKEIYFMPYTRVAPFAIGLMMGWVLWKTKCKVKMNKVIVFLGWMVCFGLILTLTLSTYDENKDIPASNWSHAVRVVYETLHRPLWALAISWMIFACATGYGGYVNSILAWEGWLPLSRLTYSVFLIHLTILGYQFSAPEYKTLLTLTSLSYSFIGYFVMSYAVGYILTVTVESPMLALEKVVLG